MFSDAKPERKEKKNTRKKSQHGITYIYEATQLQLHYDPIAQKFDSPSFYFSSCRGRKRGQPSPAGCAKEKIRNTRAIGIGIAAVTHIHSRGHSQKTGSGDGGDDQSGKRRNGNYTPTLGKEANARPIIARAGDENVRKRRPRLAACIG